MGGPTGGWGGVAGVLLVLVTLMTACAGQGAASPPDQPPPSAARTLTSSAQEGSVSAHPPRSASSPSPALRVPLVRVARLPTGPPPRVAYLADGVLRYDGRTISTDFPADAVGPEILGAVDGRVVIDAYVGGVADPGEWFFAVDGSGHAHRLGGSYDVYDHSPRLVEQTGHIWINYDDRGTGRSAIWVLDARSGRQVAAYHDQHQPSGLAAADQAVYDAFTGSEQDVPATAAPSPDRTLAAETRPVRLPGGSFGDRVLIRRPADGTEVARFVFPEGAHGADGVERVVFEDDRHVLVLVTISDASPRGGEHTIVRCDVASRSCQRAVGIGGNMALGLSPPAFEPG